MPRSTSVDRAELRFRQFCCTELNGPLIAPTLFRELHDVVPFSTCLYLWLGAAGPVDAYFNVPEFSKYVALYVDKFFTRAQAQVWGTPDEAARLEFGPQHLRQVLRISPAAYMRHALYNEVMLPSSAHTFVRFLVRDNGRPIGSFGISRGPRDPDFESSDLQALQRLQPFIVHALAQRGVAPLADLADAQSAMLTVDGGGRILSMSPAAKPLLSMSQGSVLAPPVLHDGIIQSIKGLIRLAKGADPPSVPVWKSANAWGNFTARAYWLQQCGLEPQIGIFLQRQIPRRLMLLDGLRHFAFPKRQEQVALRLALGNSEEQVAKDLGLSRNTIIYHRRQIYNRLEVASRAQLVERLSASSHVGGGS